MPKSEEKGPIISDTSPHTVFEEHGTLQLAFQSNGCTFSKTGSCLMCDYYSGRNISPEELDNIFNEVMSRKKKR